MRHRRKKVNFGRKLGPRRALMRGFVDALVLNGRIRLGLVKAKAVRSMVEKAITKGKKNSLHVRRTLLSDFPNEETVSKIIGDLSVRFKDRPGGYTRIVKVGARASDATEMAILEFVDHKLSDAGSEETVKGDKEAKLRKRSQLRQARRQRKSLRKIQEQARRDSRVY